MEKSLPIIVLVRPSLPVNLGTVARAMANMGAEELRLVDPKCSPKENEAFRASAGAFQFLENARIFEDIPSAVKDCEIILGTSARKGDRRGNPLSPREFSFLSTKIGVLFGPEDTGLTNADLAYCHEILTIPTSDFHSLNLAQAVLLVLYEFQLKRFESPESKPEKEVATSEEVEYMLADCFEIMEKVDFLNPQNPEHIKLDFRRIFNRSKMDSRENKILRGFWSQIKWALGRKK